MTAQQKESLAIGTWQPEPGLTGRKPTDEMRSWLLEPGLLTQRLRNQCGGAFNLRLVNEAQHRDDATDLYRQVALCCGDLPCIFAESRIPLATVDAHFWLRDLGQEPLGERLQKNADTRRGSFIYGLLAAEQVPGWIRDSLTDPVEPLWARRYDFYIGTDTLTVTEIFLPAVLDCATNGI